MEPISFLILGLSGILAGILAGFLGIGGGAIMVPILLISGLTAVQSVGTSALGVAMAAISGSLQNVRMGAFDGGRILGLGLPALITAQFGAYWAALIPAHILLSAFGIWLLFNIYLVQLKRELAADGSEVQQSRVSPEISRLLTGGGAGILAGLFGGGGGSIMVPLQMLLLGEGIKVAIQTSVGVNIIIAISACVGHGLRGNVLYLHGILLALGGMIGAQIGARYLPRFPDGVVRVCFQVLLGVIAFYSFWKAWVNYGQL